MDFNIMAPINILGYGYVGLNVVCQLHKMGHRVSLFPIGPLEAEPQYHKPVQEMVENQHLFNPHTPSIRIYHQFSMAESIGYGDRIGWPIFELNSFSDIELHHLRSLDRIIVCSDWSKKIMEKHLLKATTIPLGVDSTVFYPKPQSKKEVDTVFFNCGKWEIRKGHDILLEAFLKAFEPKDNVTLFMHCFNPFDDNEKWIKLYKNNKMADKIFISQNGRNIPQQGIADIMNSADCCVFPARAEGWNLELLESMACGRPCIATNYSAHTEYATEKNCMLINVDKEEEGYDGRFFFGTGEWAELGEPQVDQLVEYMRAVHKEKQENGFVRANIEGVKTAKEFSWENTCQKLISYISQTTSDLI